MTDAEFQTELAELLDDTREAISAVAALHCATPAQWEAIQQCLRNIATQLEDLSEADYVN